MMTKLSLPITTINSPSLGPVGRPSASFSVPTCDLEVLPMSRVAIVTDSVATVPDVLGASLDIKWVPYYVHRGKEVLRDLLTISREAFYQWLSTASELPKTANPGAGDYLAVYEGLAREGIREIVSIHITSKGSGAYQRIASRQNLTPRATLPHG